MLSRRSVVAGSSLRVRAASELVWTSLAVRLREEICLGCRVMPRVVVYVVGDAGPFALQAKSSISAQRNQFLLVKDDLNDRGAISVFCQERRFEITKNRNSVKDAGTFSDACGFADNRLIIDDVHKRNAVEGNFKG